MAMVGIIMATETIKMKTFLLALLITSTALSSDFLETNSTWWGITENKEEFTTPVVIVKDKKIILTLDREEFLISKQILDNKLKKEYLILTNKGIYAIKIINENHIRVILPPANKGEKIITFDLVFIYPEDFYKVDGTGGK